MLELKLLALGLYVFVGVATILFVSDLIILHKQEKDELRGGK